MTGSNDFDDDVLDRMFHGEGVGLEKSGVIPAVFLSWCANNGLLDPSFADEHESLVVRIKMRDLDCLEFFSLAAAGELRKSQLSRVGKDFVSNFYQEFHAIALETAQSAPDVKWALYDELAGWLTSKLIQATRRKKWWQFWLRT